MLLFTSKLRRCGFILLTALLLFAGCDSTSSQTNTQPFTIDRPQYHLRLIVSAGWRILHERTDPNSTAPYSIEIGHISSVGNSSYSLISIDIFARSAPGINDNIASIEQNPQYHQTQIHTLTAYETSQINYTQPPTLAPGQSILPSTTPVPGTLGTIIHTEYDIPATTYFYVLTTDDVAGDNASANLAAMVQSLTIGQ